MTKFAVTNSSWIFTFINKCHYDTVAFSSKRTHLETNNFSAWCLSCSLQKTMKKFSAKIHPTDRFKLSMWAICGKNVGIGCEMWMCKLCWNQKAPDDTRWVTLLDLCCQCKWLTSTVAKSTGATAPLFFEPRAWGESMLLTCMKVKMHLNWISDFVCVILAQWPCWQSWA